MKKIIIVLLVLISSSAVAQFDYNIQPDSSQNYSKKSSNYYLKKASNNLKWAGSSQLIGTGFIVGSYFVNVENIDMKYTLIVSGSIFYISSMIAIISSGSNLSKATEALKREKQREGISFESTRNGVGLVFRF